LGRLIGRWYGSQHAIFFVNTHAWLKVEQFIMQSHDLSTVYLLVGGDSSMLPFLSQKVLNRNHIVVLSGSGGLADCIVSMRMPTLDMPFKYELTTDADQAAT
jgi:hypothetical protein